MARTHYQKSISRIYETGCLVAVSLFVFVGLLSVWPTPTNAAVAKFINFQGKLTKTSDGTNVANGTYAMQFKMYDALTSGSLLWTETWDGGTSLVTVTNGVFNVRLGTYTSLDTVDFTGASIYLSVNFNPGAGYDGEMSPRKQLVAAAYALNANNLVGDGRLSLDYAPATSTNSAARVNFVPSVSSTQNVLNLIGGANVSGASIAVSTAGTGNGIDLAGAGTNARTINSTAAALVLKTTTSGNITLSPASGIVAGSGALTLQSGGATIMAVDAGGAAALQLGTANANAVTISRSGVATTIQGTATFNEAVTVGNGAGNDYLAFAPEATNPTCSAGQYRVWANSADLKLKKCQNGTVSDLDTTGGGGGTPGGTTGQLQWNNGGAFDGVSGSTVNTSGDLVLAPAVRSTGSPTLLTVTGPAHTSLTASAEATDVNINLARTVQFATGALTTQRAMRLQAPTYGFVGASTITNAVTLDISGAPIAGANATITNSTALNIGADAVTSGTTNSYGLQVNAQTGATNNYAAVFLGGSVGIRNTAPSALLTLGTAGTTAGTLSMAGATSGTVTLQTAAAAGTWSLTLPTGAGSNGQVLQTNGSGVTSWANVQLSQLAAASATNTIDNTTNAQTWQWSTATTQTGLTLTGGSAMTTGSILQVGSATYVHTTAETAAVSDIIFTDASTNTSGNSVTNGLLVAPTLSTSGAGTKEVRGLAVAAATLTGCATGNCTVNGLQVDLAANSLATVTQNGLLINPSASALSAGTVRGLFVGNLTTSGTPTTTALQVGTGWTTGLQVSSGNWLGALVTSAQSLTSTQTVTVSNPGLIFAISNNTGATAANINITFNLTGLPATDGAFIMIDSAAIKGATGAAQTSTVTIQVNGTLLSSVATASSTAAATVREKYVAARVGGAWKIVSGLGTADTADLAEWVGFTGTEAPQQGALVALDGPVAVRPTQTAYDDAAVGIVSTAPNIVLGKNMERGVHLTLAGRVPALVTSVNGSLAIGDSITAADISGFGMKQLSAGTSVGRAMDTFDPAHETCVAVSSLAAISWPDDQDGANTGRPCFAVPVSSLSAAVQQSLTTTYNLSLNDTIYVGKVMVLVGTHYADPSQVLRQLRGLSWPAVTEAAGVDTAKTLLQTLVSSADSGKRESAASAPAGMGVAVDRLAAGLEIVTPRVVAQSLVVNTIASVSGMITITDLVSLTGHLVVGDDTAGSIEVPEGATEVSVKFTQPYDGIPVVTVSPVVDADTAAHATDLWSLVPNALVVPDNDGSGFTLHIEKPLEQPVRWNWIAVGKPSPSSAILKSKE